MRTRLTIAAFVVLGLALGYCAGFVTSGAQAISEMPTMGNPRASHDAFTNLFQAVGRLGGAEILAGSCGQLKSDPLSVEEAAIRSIQEGAAAANLNPPLDVARARLALRRANLAEKNNDPQLKAQYEQAAQQLLQQSGWKDPSPAHLRQIVTKLDTDGNTCSPTQAQGGQPK